MFLWLLSKINIIHTVMIFFNMVSNVFKLCFITFSWTDVLMFVNIFVLHYDIVHSEHFLHILKRCDIIIICTSFSTFLVFLRCHNTRSFSGGSCCCNSSSYYYSNYNTLQTDLAKNGFVLWHIRKTRNVKYDVHIMIISKCFSNLKKIFAMSITIIQ